MKLRIEMTGGYAGERIPIAAVDSTRVAPAVAGELDEAWRRLHAKLPGLTETRDVGADFVRYEIFVENEDSTERFDFVDDGSPAAQEAKELVQQIQNAVLDSR